MDFTNPMFSEVCLPSTIVSVWYLVSELSIKQITNSYYLPCDNFLSEVNISYCIHNHLKRTLNVQNHPP